MGKMSSATGSGGTGGGVTRRTGQAFKPKGSATRGFTPPGAKGAAGSPVVQADKTKKRKVGKTAYDVDK